jgi:hypothetical protein
MADDTAALLRQLKIGPADVFGYSMGGTVALALAVRHPALVRRVAVFGSHAGPIDKAYNEDVFKQFKELPADFAPPFLKDPYDKVAPDRTKWPVLVAKIKKMALEWGGLSEKDLKSIKARVLIALGDHDGPKVEHAAELFRAIPDAQLAVFPGGDHFMPWQSPDKLFPRWRRSWTPKSRGRLAMRYMILVKGTKDTERGAKPTEALIYEMAAYHEELAKAGVLLDGSGLHPSAKGWRVRYDGAKRKVVDGPFAEAKELVAGYTLIQMKSEDEAREWTRRFPNPSGDGGKAEIEVRRIADWATFASLVAAAGCSLF